MKRSKAVDFRDKLMQILKKYGLDSGLIRGQGTDGCSTMSGNRGGLRTLVREISLAPPYVHYDEMLEDAANGFHVYNYRAHVHKLAGKKPWQTVTVTYFTALSEEDQKWYTLKLTLTDGHTLADPYSFIEDWKLNFVNECDESAERLETHLIETGTAEENDENSIPKRLVSLFQPAPINDSREELNIRMKKLFNDYKKAYWQTQHANFCEVTRYLGITKGWQIHRAGRITTSIAKEAFNADKMKIAEFPKTFLKTIVQYGYPFDVPATRNGKAMEPVARKYFIAHAMTLREGFSTQETGLHVLEDITRWTNRQLLSREEMF
eukprot:gene18564-20426_t